MPLSLELSSPRFIPSSSEKSRAFPINSRHCRAALLIALIQTPHRFRTKRQLWTYSGLGLETHDSAQYRVVEGQLQRSKKPVTLRGLNQDHNRDLKDIFRVQPPKSAAATTDRSTISMSICSLKEGSPRWRA